MIKSELSVQINASPEQVFARWTNPMNAVEDVPTVTEIRDINGQGKDMTYTMVGKMVGMPMSMHITVTEFIPNRLCVVQCEMMGKTGTTTSRIEPCDGGCRLSMVSQYEVPIPLLGKLAEPLIKKLNEREWQVALENAKTRLEAQASTAVA